jgi:hypothetical protein
MTSALKPSPNRAAWIGCPISLRYRTLVQSAGTASGVQAPNKAFIGATRANHVASPAVTPTAAATVHLATARFLALVIFGAAVGPLSAPGFAASAVSGADLWQRRFRKLARSPNEM